MVEEKCPKCGSTNTNKTGIVLYSYPAQIEYYCFDCKQKFTTVEEQNITIPEGYEKRPDLKGCFNCKFYLMLDQFKFECKQGENFYPAYIDVCNKWEKLSDNN